MPDSLSKPRKKRPRPQSLDVQSMVKQITLHVRTGQALASGLTGSVIGEVAGALTARLSKGAFPFSATYTSELGFVVGVVIFLFLAPHARLQDCLTVARSLFIDDRITDTEYQLMRTQCLQRWGL